MRRILFFLFALLLMTTPLHAQDDSGRYHELALQRIELARKTNATKLEIWGITELPPEIGQLHNLEVLVLIWCDLTSLPPEIGQLTNLQVLGLGDTSQISPDGSGFILPPEIGNLGELQILRLNSNNLTSLPPEIGNLSNLRELDLFGNKLSSLPSEIGNLSNLQALNLSDNNLTSLPPEIGNLSNLQRLSLNRNELVTLPTEIGNLTQLPTLCFVCGLHLNGNPLVDPPPEVVEQGTVAVLDYLRAKQERIEAEKRRWKVAGLLGVGMLALFGLGFRRKQGRYRKPKKKRGMSSE